MMITGKVTAALLLTLMTSIVMAADNDSNLLKNDGSLDRLFKQSGVYNASSTGKTPGFVVDPSWPQPLPNNWILGQIGGLYVDPHDHIWVYNRPRTLTNEEAGLEGPVPGAVNEKGQPINGLGQVRTYGSIADCCKAAPSVLEFDAAGKAAARLGRSVPTRFHRRQMQGGGRLHLAQQRARHLCRPERQRLDLGQFRCSRQRGGSPLDHQQSKAAMASS